MPGPTTWMPVYTRDLISSTADMTPAQLGAYMRLLCYAWDNDGCPNDMEACLRIAGGISPGDWKVIRRRLIVLDEGTSEERLSQKRLEEERAICVTKYNKKVAAIRKARESNPNNGTDHSTDHSTVVSTDHSHQSESQSDSLTRVNDSSSSSTQKNLGQTRKAPPARTYRIGWSEQGGFTGITDEDRAAWATAYPGVNLVAELARAHVYLRENPAKAGKRNWGAFLARWFARVQDKGGSPQPSKPKSESWLGQYREAPYRTPKEQAARSEALASRQTPAQRSDGVTTLSDVVARLNATQEAQDGNYPD